MVKRKKIDSGYEELYVCMTNVAEKRKSILLGIKSSLRMQQEHEQIMEIRRNKALISKEIKSSLEDIKKYYDTLRKNLPNVKNILSYTEKEINELDRQINTLKADTKATESNIRLEKRMKEKLQTSNTSIRKVQKRVEKKEIKRTEEKVKTEVKEEQIVPASKVQHKLSKLDRIQNNLKVIESKLKHL